MERLNTDAIVDKEFKVVAHGYDRGEVDEFLNQVCEEIELLNQEKLDLQIELQQKTTRPVDAPVAPAAPVARAADTDSFREILEMAQKVKEETIRKANEDAEEIRTHAEEEVKGRLGNLEEEKKSLEHQVEELKKTAANYRASFESLLQAQQEALEKASDLF